MADTWNIDENYDDAILREARKKQAQEKVEEKYLTLFLSRSCTSHRVPPFGLYDPAGVGGYGQSVDGVWDCRSFGDDFSIQFRSCS